MEIYQAGDYLGTGQRYELHTFANGSNRFIVDPFTGLAYPDEPAKAGLRYAMRAGPNHNDLRQELWTSWYTVPSGGGGKAPRMARRWRYDVDAVANQRKIREELFSHDSYGNVTRQVDCGEVTVIAGTTLNCNYGLDEKLGKPNLKHDWPFPVRH